MLKEKLQDIEEPNSNQAFFKIEKFLCRVKFAPQSDGDWP